MRKLTNQPKSEHYCPEQVLSVLRGADSALLLCHIGPDGDTIGSALALKHRLERMGKKVQVAVDGKLQQKLLTLPGREEIFAEGAEPSPCDTVVAIDVSTVERMGRFNELFFKAKHTAVIDHHESNPGYAQANMIDGSAGSTAVVLYRLFLELGNLPVSEEEAACLYAAASTDTGNFIYSSTGAESFRMMAELVETGFPLETLGTKLQKEIELPFLLLLGTAISNTRIAANGAVMGFTLTRAEMDAAGADDTYRDGIIDYATRTRGVQLAFIASETLEGGTKFSLRCKPGFNVVDLAVQYHGGGHEQAAGMTLYKPLKEAAEEVEAALIKIWEGHQNG